MTETFTGLGKFASNMRAGGKRAGDGPFIDGLTAVQVDATAGLSTGELIDRLEAVGPGRGALAGQPPADAPHPDEGRDRRRRRRPGRWATSSTSSSPATPGCTEPTSPRPPASRWSSPASTTAASSPTRRPSGAGCHGQPCTLHLTGPAGGTFAQGDGGEEITIDAVEFCRILSGRGTGEGLLAAAGPASEAGSRGRPRRFGGDGLRAAARAARPPGGGARRRPRGGRAGGRSPRTPGSRRPIARSRWSSASAAGWG